MTEEENMADDAPYISDEDDAPEAVSFNQGREEALQTKSNRLRDLQRAKLKAKEKRRERDRLLKEQKQKKKVSLSNARLPPSLLNKLAQQQETISEPSGETPASEQLEKDTVIRRKDTNPLTDDADKDDEDDGEEDFDDDEEEKEPTIQVMQRSKIVRQPPHEAALQFLQNQMYGSRIRRESMAKHVSRKLKRLGKPAMNFCQTQSQGAKTTKKRRSSRNVVSDDMV